MSIFRPVKMGGEEVIGPPARILLEVVEDHGLSDPGEMYGAFRKTGPVSRARTDAWSRLDAEGWKRSDIARMFGVNRAAVSVALKRAGYRAGTCPCCGRPYQPALMRG